MYPNDKVQRNLRGCDQEAEMLGKPLVDSPPHPVIPMHIMNQDKHVQARSKLGTIS